MRLSYNWLGDFVDLSGVSAQEVAEKLTMGAFEVEEVNKIGANIKGPLVVGEICEINPHPNADKIRLTKVKVAPNAEPVDIVCGAHNIEVGQRVPVALPGAEVVNRHDGSKLVIKESKIRGANSCGMLCSPPELGINYGESEGILILNGDTKVGDDVQSLLGLFGDWVLHVEPRSNRGDALSVLGLAREVCALLGRPMRRPEWKLPEPEAIEPLNVSIESPDDCPFFSIRLLTGLKVGPSSGEIIRRLEAIGVRPVSNIVDVTNYVLHELGQPLHAYDLNKVAGRQLACRRAKSGEKLYTIDGRQRELSDEVLVIADAKNVVGVAGVMGGKDSEISNQTCDIALEAAAFQLARVRRSSRLLGLSSDSSLRFERGVDVASVAYASDRASYLLLKHAGGKLGKISTAGSDKVVSVSVNMRFSQLKRLTEIESNPQETESLLSPLGFGVESKDADTLAVSVPSFRQRDIKREIDLIEEVCRLWGYNRLPASMPKTTSAPSPAEPIALLAKRALAAQGMSEAWISSLVPQSDTKWSADAETSLVSVRNPLSPDHQVLRQSLLPGLIRAIAYNLDHGQADAWLFEVGRIYKSIGKNSIQDTKKHTGAKEELNVSGAISGAPCLANWLETNAQNAAAGKSEKNLERTTDFYTAKGIVENLLQELGACEDKTGNKIEFIADDQPPQVFHPGRTCRIEMPVKDKAGGKVLGYLGELHPLCALEFGLKKSVYLFELSLDSIKKLSFQKPFVEIGTQPQVVRDLTVDVDLEKEYQSLANSIAQAGGSLLVAVDLVSIFHSGEKKSLSYRLTFRHADQTLTNEEIENVLAKIRQALAEEVKASFRA